MARVLVRQKHPSSVKKKVSDNRHMKIFSRCDNLVKLNDEVFELSDILAVVPAYVDGEWKIHFCNGRKHYVSDGVNQFGRQLPYPFLEMVFNRLPEIRMCRSQRLEDQRYFENLRNVRR